MVRALRLSLDGIDRRFEAVARTIGADCLRGAIKLSVLVSFVECRVAPWQVEISTRV